MTEAIQRRTVATPSLCFQYHVAMSQPTSHLFEVTLEVTGWQGDGLDLKMPVWTPGSYLVREYARHVQDFRAEADRPLPWQKISKHHWRVDTPGVHTLRVSYRVYANELSVRTNHLDATHGYFNGAALFYFIPGFESHPIQVTVTPPQSDWLVTTTLPAIAHHTFEAADFDTLVDSPFEVGSHRLYDFEVLGKLHQWAIWGQGNADPARIIADTQRVIEVEAELFGGLPYDRYLFLLHLSAQGYGGLEHKNSCSLNYPRLGFQSNEKYQRFIQLVAHEFFHLWNVKRIRPKALETFDYEAENYTESLWFSEGTTSYYDLTLPFRAGLYDAKTYLQELSRELTRYFQIPGRLVQPLSESSFDAWIKLYRRDANSDNNQISYYLKGEMVSFLLDLLIRAQHDNRRSLDDVLRLMWQRFGMEEIGFSDEQLEAVITEVAGVDLTAFFQHCLHSTLELPFAQYLEPFGLELQPDGSADAPPFTGMIVAMENGSSVVKFVEMDSPAQQAGIDAGDELLAIANLRVTAEQLGDRLKDYQPGDIVPMTFFHQDELLTCSVQLAAPRPARYQLQPITHPSPDQERLYRGWLGSEPMT